MKQGTFQAIVDNNLRKHGISNFSTKGMQCLKDCLTEAIEAEMKEMGKASTENLENELISLRGAHAQLQLLYEQTDEKNTSLHERVQDLNKAFDEVEAERDKYKEGLQKVVEYTDNGGLTSAALTMDIKDIARQCLN